MKFFNKKNIQFKRKLSFSERGYFAFTKILPTFYAHMVIEGEGNSKIDINKLKSAISVSSEANPGSRLVLRGFLNFCYLEDSGVPPPLRVVENSAWDGLSSDNTDFFDEILDAREGPTCDVIYLKGSPNRIIFRVHHMVMDGMGLMLWAEDIFKILRGDNPVSFFSEVTEYDLAKSIGKVSRRWFPQDNIAPTGKAYGATSLKSRWIRRRVTGKFSNLTGQIAVLLAAEARKYADGNFWVTIPVDLRQRKNNFKTTRNFTGIIYVEVKPEHSAFDISANIRHQLNNSEDLTFDIEDVYCRYIPVSIMKSFINRRVLKRHSKSLYGSSATISNGGFIDIEKFSGGGFNPDTIFFFTQQGYNPAFFAVNRLETAVEITLSVPDVLRTDGRDERLMDAIVNGLIPK